MTTGWVVIIFLAGWCGQLVFGVFVNLVTEEIRTRLDRLPRLVIRASSQIVVPAEDRALFLRQWNADLYDHITDQELPPITRLANGLAFAVGALPTAWKARCDLWRTQAAHRRPMRLRTLRSALSFIAALGAGVVAGPVLMASVVSLLYLSEAFSFIAPVLAVVIPLLVLTVLQAGKVLRIARARRARIPAPSGLRPHGEEYSIWVDC